MKISARTGGQALVAIVFAALAFRLFRLTAQYSVNIFFWDQWDFNDATLFEHHSFWQIFRFQHGPHRQGLGGILAALVEPWFRWNSRTEAFLATAIVVVAGLAMLYLKYRLFGSLSWTDVAIPMIVFTPAQWESVWTTVNFAHGVLPLLLIVLYCLAWTWRNERAKYALITALNFVTLYTGFGFFLGLLTPVLLFAKYREDRNRTLGTRLYLVSCIVVSAASLASFFIGYRNDNASGCDSLFSEPPLAYFQFLSLMFATPFGIRSTGLAATLIGALVLAGVAAIAAASWKRVLGGSSEPRTPHVVLAVLSAYSILFCTAATLGRTCTGLIDAHSSRYGSYRQLAVLSLFFWALTVRRPVWRKGWTYLLPVLLIPSLFLTPHDAEGINDLYEVKSGWRACYLGGHLADICDEQNGPIYPDPARTHLQRKLDFLRATRQNLFSDGPEVRR
jgi:hypothetical protein